MENSVLDRYEEEISHWEVENSSAELPTSSIQGVTKPRYGVN